ncbi:hypothetical protein HDU67_004097 [Dinochytrium kinnereticum]|nr:hypothetical protein HDU67_004097 [Dinochytrium kinnereticum]
MGDWGEREDNISIGESEGSAVAKCVGSANTVGSRRIPEGIIWASHAVKTPNAYQVTGRLNLNALKVSPRGGGGQYDDASWGIEPLSHCLGYDRYVEIVGGDMFCIRCCNFPKGTDLKSADYDRNAPCFAGNDIAGCHRVVPGNYGPGFDYKEMPNLPTVAWNLGAAMPLDLAPASPAFMRAVLKSEGAVGGDANGTVVTVVKSAPVGDGVRLGARRWGGFGVVVVALVLVCL